MATVTIVGAAGYTGQETLDRVLGHPHLRSALGSNSLAGKDAPSRLDPRLIRARGRGLPALHHPGGGARRQGADITFLCLSHEESSEVEVSGRWGS